MDEKAQFAMRLKAAMKKAGFEARPAVLEKQFNSLYWGQAVSYQAARAWLQGRALPTQDKLQVLAEWLRVEPQALRYGEQAAKKIREDRAQWETAIKHTERETFEAFLALSAPHKKIVREVIAAFAKAKS